MPRPDTLVENPVHKGGSISFVDYKGGVISTSLKSKGGDVSRGDMETLANQIGDISNACYNRVEIHNRIGWKDADLNFFDEAEASVASVIVVVLIHDDNPALNQEFIIPAYDASLLLPGTGVVDRTNANLLTVINTALGIVNDDDNPVAPDEYHDWRAYTATRKIGRGTVTRSLPLPVEPGAGDNPPQAPGV